jgi:hypothetical protein
MAMSHTAKYLDQAKQITAKIDDQVIESMVEALAALREKGGRLFFIGVGGSAGNGSTLRHAHGAINLSYVNSFWRPNILHFCVFPVFRALAPSCPVMPIINAFFVLMLCTSFPGVLRSKSEAR